MAAETLADVDTKPRRRSVVQSVSRVFEILNLLRVATSPLSVQEVARATGLDRTVTHRLLNTLLQESMVVEERGQFRMGPASTLLSNKYIDDLLVRRLAMPYLMELQQTELKDQPWTPTLSIAVGKVATVIERLWTPLTPLDLVLSVGDSFPINIGAAGRSMLAYYETQHVIDLLGAETAADVAPTLETVRESGGVGISNREAVPGVQAIAAVVLSRRKTPIASISVSGVDLGDQLDADSSLASALRRAASAMGKSVP